jgi:hypothetical protein
MKVIMTKEEMDGLLGRKRRMTQNTGGRADSGVGGGGGRQNRRKTSNDQNSL